MTRLIKYYPNRKLYDTNLRKYISLDGLADLIHQGEDIQVVDNVSGADLTALSLTQIIYEQEKQHAGLLPRSILTGLVRAGKQALDVIINPSYYIDEQVIENALREQGVPRREDIQCLIYQVDALSTKIDEINRDHKSV